MKKEQSVPKRLHIKFRLREITQKKTNNSLSNLEDGTGSSTPKRRNQLPN